MQESLGVGIPAPPTPKASPMPLLGTGDQIRANGVSFDVADDSEEMLVAFNWERLETTLI